MCPPETDWSCPDTCNHTLDIQSLHNQPLEEDDRKRGGEKGKKINKRRENNNGGRKIWSEEGEVEREEELLSGFCSKTEYIFVPHLSDGPA